MMMPSAAMLGAAHGMPSGIPMGRGARRSRPMRGGAFGRPARLQVQQPRDGGDVSSSSSSTTPSLLTPSPLSTTPPTTLSTMLPPSTMLSTTDRSLPQQNLVNCLLFILFKGAKYRL